MDEDVISLVDVGVVGGATVDVISLVVPNGDVLVGEDGGLVGIVVSSSFVVADD